MNLSPKDPNHRRRHRHNPRASDSGSIGHSSTPTTTTQSIPTRADNLGPLTTTFTPPPHCTRAALACPTCETASLGQSCRLSIPWRRSTTTAFNDPACLPPTTAAANPSTIAQQQGFYSPGLICPTGYVRACSANPSPSVTAAAGPQSSSNDFPFQFPLTARETAVGCCPTGYACAGDPANGAQQACYQAATSTRLNAVTCAGDTMSEIDNFAVPFTVGANTVTTMHLWAPMVQINWRDEDLPRSFTTTTSLAQTQSSATSTSTPTVSQGPQTVAHDSPSGNLAVSAIAGIAVSAIISFFILCAVVVYFRYRKPRVADEMIPMPRSRDPSTYAKSISGCSMASASTYMTTGKVHSITAFSTPLPSRGDEEKEYVDILLPPPPAALPLTDRHGTAERDLTPITPVSPPAAFLDTSSLAAAQAGTQPRPPSPVSPLSPTLPSANLSSHQHFKSIPPPIDIVAASQHSLRRPSHSSITSLSPSEFGLESPIDGTSPFRLKRGSTLKRTRSKAGQRKGSLTVIGEGDSSSSFRPRSTLREVMWSGDEDEDEDETEDEEAGNLGIWGVEEDDEDGADNDDDDAGDAVKGANKRDDERAEETEAEAEDEAHHGDGDADGGVGIAL